MRGASLVQTLHKHRDALKTDMMRKRSLMEKALQQQVRAEIDDVIGGQSPLSPGLSSPEAGDGRKRRSVSGGEKGKAASKRRRQSSEMEMGALSPPAVAAPTSTGRPVGRPRNNALTSPPTVSVRVGSTKYCMFVGAEV